MKRLLTLIAMLLSVVSAEGAYKSFRSWIGGPIREALLDTTGDPVIDALPPVAHFDVSFTCDPGATYVLWASETLGGTWFPIKTVTAGQEFTTLSQMGGEDIVTVQVPMPFLTWSTSGKGFLRVSETAKEQEPTEYIILPVTGAYNFGEYITVAFLSEPGSQYYIKGASTLTTPFGEWCPVDTYSGGQVIQTTTPVYATGTITWVDLANPLLPWIEKNGGYILISKKPSVTSSSRQAAATTIQNSWSLVCTRDGGSDQHFRFKDLGLWGLSGHISVDLSVYGPHIGENGKYRKIVANAVADLYGNFVPDTRIWLPKGLDPTVAACSAQWVRLTFYEWKDAQTIPEVKFEPNPDKYNDAKGAFSFQLINQSGSVIGAAAYQPDSPLGDSLKLEPLGMGFEVKFPKNSGQVSCEQTWQFAPMDRQTLLDYLSATGQQ